MTEETPQADAVRTAGDLVGAMRGLRDEVKTLNAFGKRNRHLIWGTIGSLCLDVVLTAVIAVLAYQGHATSASLAEFHSAQVSACRLSNQSRAQEILLWTHIAAVSSPPPHLSKAALAANRRKITLLLAYIRKVFASRDCEQIYRLP